MGYQEFQPHLQPAQHAADRWLRRCVWAAKGVLVLGIFAIMVVGFKQPVVGQQAIRAQVARLTLKKEMLKSERDRLQRRLQWLQTDSGYLEMEVRDRLNLQKSDEFVLRFVD